MSTGRQAEIITITGDIGSGKSVVGRALSARLGYDFFSTGTIQREIAAQRGMTTLELNAHSEEHPEVDYEIDGYSKEMGRSRARFILDSRLAWHFIPHSYKVYLAVEAPVAAQRILNDRSRKSETYHDAEEALRDILERRKSELARFETLYHVDCENRANFDLVVDTSLVTPDAVADTVMTGFRQWLDGAGS